MRIGIDMQLAVGTSTGIGEYARGLLGALRAANDRDLDYAELRLSALDPWRFDRRVFWDQIGLPFAAARAGADLVHATSGTMPLLRGTPYVATVHDVAWLRVQGHARAYARAYFGPFALARYRAARRVFVDSAFSRDELLALSHVEPERVVVAYPGVAADVCAVVRARDDARPYLLAVGTVEVRKNLAVVIRALARLPGLRLISAGPPTPYARDCADLAAELGVADRVAFRGYVPRADLLALYAGALAAVVPSTYEGFGYGAAQALCAGVPLVSSDASSLPEVTAGAAPLVSPHDADAWHAALAAIAADPHAAEERARAGRAAAAERFSWRATAAIVASAYRAVLAG